MWNRPCEFSKDLRYRYTLWREFDPLLSIDSGYVMFIGLNPSTATDEVNDPTIRRCVGFAKAWGYGALCMTNLFAYRATNPRVMQAQTDPIGAENDHWLRQCAKEAAVIVAAWGSKGAHRGRGLSVACLLLEYPLMCLGLTKEHFPRHPLYAKSNLVPVRYSRFVPTRWLLRDG